MSGVKGKWQMMNGRISARTELIEKVSIEPEEAGHDQSNSAAITITKEQIRIITFFGERENINSNDYA